MSAMNATVSERWYSGDVNPEYGGVWYDASDAEWGYVTAVRVTPCSDAGGPDNEWWVDELCVDPEPPAHERDQALRCIGWDDPEVPREVLVEALVAWGRYDQDSSLVLRIGPPEDGGPGWYTLSADVDLPEDADLSEWVASEYPDCCEAGDKS